MFYIFVSVFLEFKTLAHFPQLFSAILFNSVDSRADSSCDALTKICSVRLIVDSSLGGWPSQIFFGLIIVCSGRYKLRKVLDLLSHIAFDCIKFFGNFIRAGAWIFISFVLISFLISE